MRLRDMDVYQLTYVLGNPAILFKKDKREREFNNSVLEDMSDDVLNPEISTQGLMVRQENLTLVSTVFSIIAIMLCGIVVIIEHFKLFEYTQFLMFFPFYFFGFAIHVGLFRAYRASVDEKRFKREGKPKDFKINTKAHITWYDFLMGIPLGLLVMLDLVSRM